MGTSAIHMPGSIEYSQAASTVTSVGNGIGPGTSAWRWHRYARVIPHWWRLTFTVSRAGTRPSARTATAPTRRSSIWCSSVRPTITPGGTPGQETPSQPICDASGATWNGLGRWPASPPTGNERERERSQVRVQTTNNTLAQACTAHLTVQRYSQYTDTPPRTGS